MSELLNCPFCGRSMGAGDYATSAMGVSIVCANCGASCEWCDDRSDANDAWNRRTPQPVTPAGGEVAEVCVHDGRKYLKWSDGDYEYMKVGTRLYVTDTASLASQSAGGEVLAWRATAGGIIGNWNDASKIPPPNYASQPGEYGKVNIEFAYSHPPVADAALSVKTMNNIRQVLANVSMKNFTSLDERHHIDAAFGLIRELDAAIDAALNQRGGGDHG